MNLYARFRPILSAAMAKPKVWAPLLLAMTICSLIYWFALRSPSSMQAFVNTSVIVMRAPVAGKLELAPSVQVGNSLQRDEGFGTIVADQGNARMSQLRILEEELLARAANLEEQIAGTASRLQEHRQQLTQYTGEGRVQRQLQVQYSQAQLHTARQEYLRSTVNAKLMEKDVERARILHAKGYISAAALEKSVASMQLTAAAVGVQKAQVEASELSLHAYTAGLQLDGPRTLSQPDSRMRELRTAIVELDQQARSLERNMASTRDELARVRAEMDSLRNVTLKAPKSGVVWAITAQPGENVAASDQVLQMISCENVWVEGFFDEADVARIRINDNVRVRLLQGGRTWQGRVETIRSGAGRVSVGQYLVDPPPEIARRQLPVRVATVRVKVDWDNALQPAQFCLAGSSAEVLL